jgi:phosphate transport system protein
MRTVFHRQLGALTVGIADTCQLVGQAMQRATEALLQADLLLTEDVFGDHGDIVIRAAEMRDETVKLLALQAPVARDLRAVVGTLKNVANVERMGELAVHVAKIVRRRHPSHAVPDEVAGYFAEMGRIAVHLGNDAKDVVLSGDPHKAIQLDDDDDAIDDLHRHLFSVLMEREWKYGVAAAVDVTLLGRFYERFADHAVEIGRRVIYQATGNPTIG